MPPRTAARGKSATPARTPGPTNAIQQATPSRRSARGTSRQAASAKDVVANPALPEIHTQQSYAYGASKAPTLPEQLGVAESMTIKDVAARINSATEAAERRFEAHAAVTRGMTPDSQTKVREERVRRRASREPSDEDSSSRGTPEQLRKTQRTAAWASSLDDSHLEDIPEETSSHPRSESRRADTEPSSFPSGIFDHSYNYERGLRGPKSPPRPGLRERMSASLQHTYDRSSRLVTRFGQGVYQWVYRLLSTFATAISDLPDSPLTSSLFKTFVFIVFSALMSLTFCTVFTYSCDSDSISVVSQSLQSFCGSCRSTSDISYNLTLGDEKDSGALLSTLHKMDKKIHSMESRFEDKISINHESTKSQLNSLRRQHSDLETHVQRLQDKSLYGGGSSEGVTSPLISKINYFSPSNGALIDPYATSPTRQKPYWLPSRIVMRALGILRYKSNPPITALEPWQGEGDCWCASAPATAQDATHPKPDSARLGVTVKELIYPTELVVEHFPAEGSLTPEIAPKDIELWADFSHLSAESWKTLHISDLQNHLSDDPASPSPPFRTSQLPPSFQRDAGSSSNSWARIAQAQYAISPPSAGHVAVPHVQAFSLDVNQDGLVHAAQRFVLRVVRNHGADFTCLYRVRLHGVPVKGKGGASSVRR